MAATAKGCQTKTAEQHNQERRAAKARQAAARKAAAKREEIEKNNYKAGFKFVKNEADERFEELRFERARRENLKNSEPFFRDWLKELRAGKQVRIDHSIDHFGYVWVAIERLKNVAESFPELYNYTWHEEYWICQRVSKA